MQFTKMHGLGNDYVYVDAAREAVDDPAALALEWERKNVVPALRDLYDEIWIYGLPQINKPLTGIEVPPDIPAPFVAAPGPPVDVVRSVQEQTLAIPAMTPRPSSPFAAFAPT